MPRDLPDLKPGDSLPAWWLNTLRDWLKSAGIRIDGSSGLGGTVGPQGTALSLRTPEEFWILTSGSGPAYAWTEQVPAAGGTWTAGVRSGTALDDPAYEVNGLSSALAKRVWATRDRAVGELRFLYGAC